MLAHVLVSEQFYDHSRRRVWVLEKSRMWNDHVGGEQAHASDHGVVAAYFVNRPA